MSVERDIRFELLARLCPNSTGKTNTAAFTLSVLCPSLLELLGYLLYTPFYFPP